MSTPYVKLFKRDTLLHVLLPPPPSPPPPPPITTTTKTTTTNTARSFTRRRSRLARASSSESTLSATVEKVVENERGWRWRSGKSSKWKKRNG